MNKIILRFLKNPTTSVINLLGLSIGIAACILLLLFVEYEKSFDEYHKKSEQVYRLRYIDSKNGKVELDGTFASPPMGSAFQENLPEIKSFVRFFKYGETIIDIGERKFEEKRTCYVDSSYFELFSTKLIFGDKKQCLSKPNTAVLSKSTAQKYFGSTDPMGKSFKLNGRLTFEVTGVYEDMPVNSHFHFKVLLSYNTFIG